jgi:hypothetical protein
MIQHRYPEAQAQFAKTLETNPTFVPANFYISILSAMTGHFADAITELRKFAAVPGNFSPDARGYNQCILAFNASLEGSTIRGGAPSAAAISYAILGDRNKTFEYLDKAYAIGDLDLIQSLRYAAFDPYRSDPRYKDLMRRLNLPE